MKRTLNAVFAGILVTASCSFASSLPPLQEQVRHQLVMLSRVGVFDNLQFQLDGETLTLSGQVAQPILKSDAERAVKRIEGVARVVNQIEVLPLSPYDDRLRLAVYSAVYRDPNFSTRYGLSAVPSIRIIVRNGEVQLAGVVSNEFDRTVAGLRANGVFGAFRVSNDLQVAK